MSKRINLLEFGDFLLDTSQKTLRRGGERISLSPRPMAMLLILIENRHRIVSHDELMERVWDGVVVEESNIATNIARLRRVLTNGQGKKGNGDSRQFIETISGYGYQFMANVREVEREHETSQPEPPIHPIPSLESITPNQSEPPSVPAKVTVDLIPPRLSVYRNWRYWLGFAAVIALAVVGWNFLHPKQAFIDASKIKHRDVIGWKNRLEDPILLVRPSPNGLMIAYPQTENGENGESDIFIQNLVTGQPIRITSEEWRDEDPIWAPDGQQIAYLSYQDYGIELATTDILTPQRKVLATFERNANIRLLRWSNKENRIFYAKDKNVFVFSPQTQQKKNLTNFKEEKDGPDEFGLSLDEEKIAYIKTVNGKRTLFAARVNGDQERQLTQAGEEPADPEWFPDHEHILYGARFGGSYQVSVIGLNDDKPIMLTATPESSFPYHLTPDGKKILYVVTNGEGNLYRCDIRTKFETDMVLNNGMKAWPDVSPDGKKLAFQSIGNGLGSIHSVIYGTSLKKDSLSSPMAPDGFDPRWSPNGNMLAFMRYSGGWQLWLVESQNAAPRLLTKDIKLQQGYMRTALQWHQPNNYSWSPDGSFVVFSARKSGIANLSAIGIDGQPRPDRSQNNNPHLSLISPMWSPDGTRIAYLTQMKATGKSDRSLVVNNGERDQTILNTESPLRMIGWQGNTYFLVGSMEPRKFQLGELTLKKISLTGAETQEVIDKTLPIYLYSLRLSPDGQTLAFTARQNNCDNVWLYSLATHQLTLLTTNKEEYFYLTGLVWLPDGSGLCYSKHSTSTSIKAIELFN